MNESKLVVKVREGNGTSMARRLRRTGQIPGVINGEGKSRKIQLDAHAFKMLLRHHTGENLLLDVEVEGEATRKVLLKQVQHDGITGDAIHVDFQAISMTRKMRVRIPLLLVGEPVGVLQEGGILEQILREIEIECLPTDMIEQIEVDVSGLNLGKTLLVRDVKVDPKLTVMTGGDVAVAGVMAPQKEEEVAVVEGAVPAEGAATAEPEVITETEAKERQQAKEGDKPGAKGGAEGAGKAKAGAEAGGKAKEAKKKA